MVPQSFKPLEERKAFMRELANKLNDEEKNQLARYVASTQAGYSISPFFSPVPFDVSSEEGIRRQNIAVAITPQAPKMSQIEDFLKQKDIRREMFLVAMANPHLQQVMPLGTLLANAYRITLQYSPSNRKEVSIRQAIQEQVDRSYAEELIGSEPKGLLPLEELAGLIVIDNLGKLPDEDLETRFAQIIPQVLEAEQPLLKLESFFPDAKLFFDEWEMYQLTQDIEGLKNAIEHPDQVPNSNFWDQVLTKPNKTFDFLTQIRYKLTQKIYQAGGEAHLQKWREAAKSFEVSEGQDRKDDPLTLTFLNDHQIIISGKDGLRFALIRREDGHWYLTSYWDKKLQKQIFDIEGMDYEKLRQQIAASPFQYRIESDFLREILRGTLNDLATKVYKQIKTQVDIEAMNKDNVYPSYAAIAYREEGALSPLRDFQYLIGGITPYGTEIYKSIFFALVRHLYQHGKLSETDLSVAAPLTGESVTVSHPLLELPNLSFEEIRKRLKETSTDVRVPEITIRKSGGYELRAKAWVYETLLKLKDLGFDAVLGKTMAEEFNRQTARIYVESALTNLGFLPENYQREKPLSSLKQRQQKVYSKALELGFTVPLESGYYLNKSLSLPLTWEREEQLWEYLKEKLSKEELHKFTSELGLSDVDEYFKTRIVFETFLNFASGWKWSQYDRSNEFPVYKYSSRRRGYSYSATQTSPLTKSVGEFAVSTQAQEKFKVAKKTWGGFLEEVKQQSLSLDDSWQQRISPVLELANGLVSEIDKMSQAEVTEWAEKIIKGEMAAVGKDMRKPIEVNTWDDFYEAVKQLMDTARLVLIYRSEKGRFGWEVSTDKEEIS